MLKKNFWLKLYFIFILFILAIVLLSYRDYGISWDQWDYLEIGKFFTGKIFDRIGISNNIVSGYDSRPIHPQHLQSRGAFFDVLISFIIIFVPNATVAITHLIYALIGLVAIILSSLIIKIVFGIRYAVLSILLFFFFAPFYGHMFINPIDIPTAMCFAANVFLFLLYLQKRKKATYQILLGGSLAFCISQRFVLIYLLFIELFIIFLYYLADSKKEGLLSLIGQIINILLFCIITAHLIHPYLVIKPITGLIEIIKTSTAGGGFALYNDLVLFEGKQIMAAEMPWYYLPKTILITTPFFIVFLLVIGMFYLLISLINQKKPAKNRIIKLYFLLLFLTPFVLDFLIRPAHYDSWRHFLFLAVPIIIIAVYGFYALYQTIKIPYKKIVFFVLVLLFSANMAFEYIKLHPYQYIFYNSIVGGLKGAYGKYETDFWGVGYKEAVEWFNNNINKPDQKYVIATDGSPLSSYYYFKKNMKHKYGPVGADYYISFTRWNRHLRTDGPVVHTISRKGVPLIYIRKVINDVDAINQ